MRDQGTQHTSLREPTCATFQVRVSQRWQRLATHTHSLTAACRVLGVDVSLKSLRRPYQHAHTIRCLLVSVAYNHTHARTRLYLSIQRIAPVEPPG